MSAVFVGTSSRNLLFAQLARAFFVAGLYHRETTEAAEIARGV